MAAPDRCSLARVELCNSEDAAVRSSFVRATCAGERKTAVFGGYERLDEWVSELVSYVDPLVIDVAFFGSAGFGFKSRGAHHMTLIPFSEPRL
jgi:hypothetical protein